MLTFFLNILWISFVGGWLIILTQFEHDAAVHLLLLLAAIVYVFKLMSEEWKKSL